MKLELVTIPSEQKHEVQVAAQSSRDEAADFDALSSVV